MSTMTRRKTQMLRLLLKCLKLKMWINRNKRRCDPRASEVEKSNFLLKNRRSKRPNTTTMMKKKMLNLSRSPFLTCPKMSNSMPKCSRCHLLLTPIETRKKAHNLSRKRKKSKTKSPMKSQQKWVSAICRS